LFCFIAYSNATENVTKDKDSIPDLKDHNGNNKQKQLDFKCMDRYKRMSWLDKITFNWLEPIIEVSFSIIIHTSLILFHIVYTE